LNYNFIIIQKQILFMQIYSSKCDVWSIGAVIYELIYGHHPYYHGHNP
jgi:serine/threonine protein kinase